MPKPYVPRTGDRTDALLGPPDTIDEVFERAESKGMDVGHSMNDYRHQGSLLRRTGVVVQGFKRGPKRPGRWRLVVGGPDIPLDGAAKRYQQEQEACHA